MGTHGKNPLSFLGCHCLKDSVASFLLSAWVFRTSLGKSVILSEVCKLHLRSKVNAVGDSSETEHSSDIECHDPDTK